MRSVVRVHFGPPPFIKALVGVKSEKREFLRQERQSGLERRLLATVRWTVATAVAFPQESESLAHQKQKPLWGVSSAGRAPALQAGGHRFDPGTLHHKKLTEVPSKEEASLNFLGNSVLHLEN